MSDTISDLEKRCIMSKYMNTLRISGYDHKYRYELLKGICNRQSQICEEIENGTRIKYRSREEILEQKARKLGKYANTWFLRGKIQNTFKVQATPDSVLLNSLKTH